MKNLQFDPVSAYVPKGTPEQVKLLKKQLEKADKESKRLGQLRGNLGPDAPRSRMTTANARWARAAEYRDRVQTMLDEEKDAQPKEPGKLTVIQRDGTRVEVEPFRPCKESL